MQRYATCISALPESVTVQDEHYIAAEERHSTSGSSCWSSVQAILGQSAVDAISPPFSTVYSPRHLKKYEQVKNSSAKSSRNEVADAALPESLDPLNFFLT